MHILSYITSILSGFSLCLLLKYSTEHLYFYWKPFLSISLFFYFLFFIFWLCLLPHFKLKKLKAKKLVKVILWVIFIGNYAYLLFMYYTSGLNTYKYIFPLLYSVNILIHFVVHSYRAFYNIHNQAFFAIGFSLALLPLVIFNNIPFILSVSLLISLIAKYFNSYVMKYPASQVSFKPVKKTSKLHLFLIVMKYLFLLSSCIHVLNFEQKNFYIVILILIIGFFIQWIIKNFDTYKHNLRHGIWLLQASALFFYALFYLLNFHLTMILGFIFIHIWQFLFLKKNIQRFMYEEYYIIGILLPVIILLHSLTDTWSKFFILIVFTVIQIYIFLFSFKQKRKVILILFILSILTGIFYLIYFYNSILVKNHYFIYKKNNVHRNFSIKSLNTLLRTDSIIKKVVYTNLLPSSILRTLNRSQYFKDIKYINIPPIVLPLYIRWQSFLKDSIKNNNFSYLTLVKGHPFYNNEAFASLNALLSNRSNILIQRIQPKVSNLPEDKVEPLWINQNTDKNLLDLCFVVATWLKQNRKYSELRQFLEQFSFNHNNHLNDLKVLRELYQPTHQFDKQLKLTELMLKKMTSPTEKLKEEKKYIQFLYFNGEYKRAYLKVQSLQFAYQLLEKDLFFYFSWSLKCLAYLNNRYYVNKLNNELSNWKPMDQKLDIEKKLLLNQVAYLLSSKESWKEIQDKERELQEELAF